MFLGFGVAILVGVNICAILCLWIFGDVLSFWGFIVVGFYNFLGSMFDRFYIFEVLCL